MKNIEYGGSLTTHRPTEVGPSGRLRLTAEAQVLLVAETMAQVREPGEVVMTGVLGGVEALTSPSQREWYRKESERVLGAARKAAKKAVVVKQAVAA